MKIELTLTKPQAKALLRVANEGLNAWEMDLGTDLNPRPGE